MHKICVVDIHRTTKGCDSLATLGGGVNRRPLPFERAVVGAGCGRVGIEQIGLVNNQDIRNLHQTGFRPLDLVAQLGHEHHDDRVRHFRNLHFILPRAHRLHDHDVETRRIQCMDDLRCRIGYPAMMVARRQAANEHAFVLAVPLHPQAVAQQRSARDRARRINRDDADGLVLSAQIVDEPVDQRTFPYAGRPGDAEDARVARAPVEFRRQRLAAFETGHQPGKVIFAPFYRRVFVVNSAMVAMVLPGPKTSLIPSFFNFFTSSSGMIPPAKTNMPLSFCFLSNSITRRNCPMCPPESELNPITSTSSCIAAATICSGVLRMPVYTTSIPVSRKPMATTSAPRSWPSRPALAIRTLRGRFILNGLPDTRRRFPARLCRFRRPWRSCARSPR